MDKKPPYLLAIHIVLLSQCIDRQWFDFRQDRHAVMLDYTKAVFDEPFSAWAEFCTRDLPRPH